jgi:hypothetical protein
MPHLFVNRPRLHNLISDSPELRDEFRWETINAVVYKLGGVLFILGSVLFFPGMSAYADLGAWVFIVGSLLYLLVTGHDMAEVIRHIRTRTAAKTVWGEFEFWAAFSYVVGTVLFTIGSVFFLSIVGLFAAGAWCFVLGSLLFVVGATINILQIVLEKDMITLQLLNLTAVTFVTGSVLFTVGSIPYLFHLKDPSDQETIDTFLAWQYLAGSVLFLIGGVFNYWRAYIVMCSQISDKRSNNLWHEDDL